MSVCGDLQGVFYHESSAYVVEPVEGADEHPTLGVPHVVYPLGQPHGEVCALRMHDGV